MILSVSLILDILLLLIKTIHTAKASAPAVIPVFLRFLALSSLVNAQAYYLLLGLTQTFGYPLLCGLVCTATAKIFVLFIYLMPDEPRQKNVPLYLLTVLVTLCLHRDPLPGLLSELFLLLLFLYLEHRAIEPAKEEAVPKPAAGRESDLYLKTIEDSYRNNRALMHDLKNHIIVLRSLAEAQEYDRLLEYTDSMAEKISENHMPVRSGNIVVDALLADKYHTAQRNHIFVEFLSVRCDTSMDSGDLCTVIGNLFDNAITENLRSSNTERRRISISIRQVDEELIIILQNPLFHQLNIRGGLPASDKPDLEHHGIGLKNVRRVCDVYGGTLVWDDTDGIFTITARLKTRSSA